MRYAKYNPIWEIWNEPDLQASWGAPPSASAYLKVAIPAATALRAAGANDVWSGSTGGIDLSWIAPELRNGGAYNVMNGCAVHSYVPPCSAYGQYVQLQGLVPAGVGVHYDRDVRADRSGPSGRDIQQMWYVHRILGISTMIWCELRDGSARKQRRLHLRLRTALRRLRSRAVVQRDFASHSTAVAVALRTRTRGFAGPRRAGRRASSLAFPIPSFSRATLRLPGGRKQPRPSG